MNKSLILIGCGGHARAIIDIIQSTHEWSIYGLIDLPENVGKLIHGYEVLGTDLDLEAIRGNCNYAFIAIGQTGVNQKRQEIFKLLDDLGFLFPTLISSSAFVSSNAKVGEGTSIGHGAVINSNALVGCHCIINSLCLVEHDCTIGDFCHVSTGALVNGSTSLGSGSFIGSGSIIREGLALPSNTTISAGKRVMGWPLRKTHSNE